MSQMMNKKLYVGSLPFSVTEEELHSLFSEFGTIESVRIITDKFTGQSKGFGFVEMATLEDAKKAVEGMNGKQLNGRTLIVNEARPEQKRERSFSDHSGGGDRWGGGGNEGGGRFSRDRRGGSGSRRDHG